MLPRPLRPAVAVLVLTIAACATNPATGKKEFSLMSEAQEIQLGREYDAQIRQQMRPYEDPDLQQYVQRIGLELARLSHRPDLPWTFTVVDVPAVNAFALPGGYIYITRGILPYLDNEAQLVGVLGHEIGHVTARHAASTPSDAPMPRVYCCAAWRAVTCPISWPSTPTSCASLSRYGRMPRVM